MKEFITYVLYEGKRAEISRTDSIVETYEFTKGNAHNLPRYGYYEVVDDENNIILTMNGAERSFILTENLSLYDLILLYNNCLFKEDENMLVTIGNRIGISATDFESIEALQVALNAELQACKLPALGIR